MATVQAKMATEVALDLVQASTAIKNLTSAVSASTSAWRSQEAYLRSVGAGLDAKFQLEQWLGHRQPLQQLTLSYAWLDQQRRKGEPYFKSNYAMEYLRHKFVARLKHRLVSALTAEWTLRVQQREGSYLVYENLKPTAEARPYGTHALLDLHLAWTAPRYTLFADFDNLFVRRVKITDHFAGIPI